MNKATDGFDVLNELEGKSGTSKIRKFVKFNPSDREKLRSIAASSRRNDVSLDIHHITSNLRLVNY